LMFNSQWTEILGFDGEEMKDLTYRDVTHPDDLAIADERFTELIEGKVDKYRLEKRYLRKDKGIVWTDLSVSAHKDKDNNVVNVVGMLVDISARKRLEESLQRINEELEIVVSERTRNLVEANAELQTITYTLAHDLRAPARLVAGFAGRLTDTYGTTIPEQGKHWLSLMTASANRQAQLVEDMLSYMKLGFKPVEREPIDMNALAAELTETASADAARHGPIEWRIGQLLAVEGDRALVRVILTNLISNALKYSAQAAHPAIEIGHLDRDKQPTAYYIRDNGVGFDQAQASKLFGLFQRFHDPGEYPGTGIGLAIVKRLVEKHGGRIWAESTPGAGATFTFTLQAETTGDEHKPA
jgi:PAS domain S-box-containing protein